MVERERVYCLLGAFSPGNALLMTLDHQFRSSARRLRGLPACLQLDYYLIIKMDQTISLILAHFLACHLVTVNCPVSHS